MQRIWIAAKKCCMETGCLLYRSPENPKEDNETVFETINSAALRRIRRYSRAHQFAFFRYQKQRIKW